MRAQVAKVGAWTGTPAQYDEEARSLLGGSGGGDGGGGSVTETCSPASR
jgi:hypothetical protein